MALVDRSNLFSKIRNVTSYRVACMGRGWASGRSSHSRGISCLQRSIAIVCLEVADTSSITVVEMIFPQDQLDVFRRLKIPYILLNTTQPFPRSNAVMPLNPHHMVEVAYVHIHPELWC